VSWAAPQDAYGPGGSGAGNTRSRSGGWWLAAIALLLAAGASFVLGLHGGSRSLPGPLSTNRIQTAPRVVSAAARSTPLTLSIPSIGLKVPVTQLGLNSNDTIETPRNYQVPGWYRLGPSPGQRGSAVILGHVDSYRGPAVFFKLRTLRPGDHVDITLADRVIAHFEVRQVAMYPKADFPAALVYGSHGYSGLQLITCGGVFDARTGHYLSNIVAYTSLVSATEGGSSSSG